MTKAGIDQDALIGMFASATERQGETLRKGVADATLKALQARELSVANVRKVLQAVAEAANTGATKNAQGVDAAKLLEKAFAGMDAAVLQVVQANQRALEQFVEQGVDLQDQSLNGVAQTLLRGYASLAGGILTGMSEGLQPAAPAAPGRTRKA